MLWTAIGSGLQHADSGSLQRPEVIGSALLTRAPMEPRQGNQTRKVGTPMLSLNETVLGLLAENDGLDRLADQVRTDRAHATSAADRVVPAVIAGLATRAGLDDGPATVGALLEGGGDDAIVITAADAGSDDGARPDGSVGAGDPVIDVDAGRRSDELLQSVFGHDRDDVISDIAAAVEMGRSMTVDLVATLVPLVILALGQRRADDGLDPDGVADLLASEHRLLAEAGRLDSIDALRLEAGRVEVGAAARAGRGVGGADAAMVGSFPGRAATTARTDPATPSTTGVQRAPVLDPGDRSADRTGDGDAEVVAGGVPAPRSPDGRQPSRFSWLRWAVGAATLVLFLGWLLSTCADGTAETGAGTSRVDVDTAEGAVDGPVDDGTDGTDGDGIDQADRATSTVSPSTTEAGSIPDPTDDDLQVLVDAALEGSAVSGVVDDRIAALSGTVGAEIDRTAALAAVTAVPGLLSIDDAIVVEGALEEGTGTGEGDEVDGSTGAVAAGATINGLLDLAPVTFDISSDRITADGRAVLDEVAAFLDDNGAVRVEIGGHTDNDGKVDANLDLSGRRAVSVKAYLESRGIDGGRLETAGYGEDRPLVPNDSSAAKAENRRIEFTVL